MQHEKPSQYATHNSASRGKASWAHQLSHESVDLRGVVVVHHCIIASLHLIMWCHHYCYSFIGHTHNNLEQKKRLTQLKCGTPELSTDSQCTQTPHTSEEKRCRGAERCIMMCVRAWRKKQQQQQELCFALRGYLGIIKIWSPANATSPHGTLSGSW